MTDARSETSSSTPPAPSFGMQKVGRNVFRERFQPSRIFLGVMEAPNLRSGFNVITLCFSMHCSYKPRMLAVAIQDNSLSYKLIRQASEFVLAVPGPTLLEETIYCGTRSAKHEDKVQNLNLSLSPGIGVNVPHLSQAIANIELKVRNLLDTGDHVLVVGEVVNFFVNRYLDEAPLLSVGRQSKGFDLLRKHGQHRIATARHGQFGEGSELF